MSSVNFGGGTVRGKKFLHEIMYEKLTKFPNFTLCLTEKMFFRDFFFWEGEGGNPFPLSHTPWAPGLPPAKSGPVMKMQQRDMSNSVFC